MELLYWIVFFQILHHSINWFAKQLLLNVSCYLSISFLFTVERAFGKRDKRIFRHMSLSDVTEMTRFFFGRRFDQSRIYQYIIPCWICSSSWTMQFTRTTQSNAIGYKKDKHYQLVFFRGNLVQILWLLRQTLRHIFLSLISLGSLGAK
jgi:hypothetical protein